MLFKSIFHLKVKLYFYFMFINWNCLLVLCFTGKQVNAYIETSHLYICICIMCYPVLTDVTWCMLGFIFCVISYFYCDWLNPCSARLCRYLKQTVIVTSNTAILFYSGMTICFSLKRPLPGHHYNNFKIRYNTVQIMLTVWDPIWLTKVVTVQNLYKTI